MVYEVMRRFIIIYAREEHTALQEVAIAGDELLKRVLFIRWPRPLFTPI